MLYAVGLLWVIRRDLRWGLDKDLSRELLRFGLPFLPVLLNMWIIDLSDRYLLGLYLSTSVVGIYSLGYKFGQAMQLVVTAFTMGWTPVRFKVLSLDQPQAIYSRVATFYLAAAGMAWVALTAYAPEIVRLTSTPAYFGAAQFVGPIGLAYLINGLFVIAVTGLGVAKSAAHIPLVSLGAVILNITLNLVFIPLLGPMAAALATIAAYGFLAAGSLHYSQKLYPIAYEYRCCTTLALGMVVIVGAASLADGLVPWVAALLKVLIFPALAATVIASGMVRRHEWSRLLSLSAGLAPRPLGARLRRLSDWVTPPAVGDHS
jgi:O-antigen/teichoic acid export membrane protein